MKKKYYILAAVLLCHLALLIFFAANRIVDADEGFYFNAARMVGQGLSPYTDFFYPQMMMMPTLFAPLADYGWDSFYLLRGAAVLAGFLSAVLLTLIVIKITDDFKSALVALLLFSLSGLVLSWHSVFKTLPFCHFLALGTFYFWLLYQKKRSTMYLLACGLFLSALINFRSIFIVLLIPYVISFIYLSKTNWSKKLMLFFISMVPFAIPTFMKMMESPANFFYGNLTIRLFRIAEGGFGELITNRLTTLWRLMIDPHLMIIMMLTVISIIMIRRQKKFSSFRELCIRPEGMAFLNLLFIGGVYMLPHPMSRQYVEQYLVFAIIVAAVNFRGIFSVLDIQFRPIARNLILTTIAIGYIVSLVPYFAIFIFGVRERDKRFRLSSIRQVTEQMLVLGNVSDTVLTQWPGYTFFTGQVPLRYTEIDAGANRLAIENDEYQKYNLADSLYLKNKVMEKAARLIITLYNAPSYYAVALDSNYEMAFRADEVSIYTRR